MASRSPARGGKPSAPITSETLLKKSDCRSLALEISQAVGAQDPSEELLAHELAYAHVMALEMCERSMAHAARADAPDASGYAQQFHGLSCQNTAKAAARLMDVYQRGLLTLDRLRHRAGRTITLRHEVIRTNETPATPAPGAPVAPAGPGLPGLPGAPQTGLPADE